MVVVTALMIPAVVYLRAHYLIDVPAGILVGLLITHIVDRIPLAGATHRPLATDGPAV